MIRVGIGGWNFAPWRGRFYPAGLPQTQELRHASSRLTSIEINSTFRTTPSPATFKKWAAETPDDFVFSVKASMGATMKSDLRETGEGIAKFTAGLPELGDKLGALLFALAPTKKFNAEELAAYLALLPQKIGKRPARCALEVSHESFAVPQFYDLARKHKVAVVFVESGKRKGIDEPTADFAYARLKGAVSEEETGYTPAALKQWAKRAKDWSGGGKRDVFVYFISAAKERNPAAAEALIKLVK
jgi:uncharacterized protein YecE (DUF72 family)